MYVIWFGCFLLTVGFAKRCDLAAAGFVLIVLLWCVWLPVVIVVLVCRFGLFL